MSKDLFNTIASTTLAAGLTVSAAEVDAVKNQSPSIDFGGLKYEETSRGPAIFWENSVGNNFSISDDGNNLSLSVEGKVYNAEGQALSSSLDITRYGTPESLNFLVDREYTGFVLPAGATDGTITFHVTDEEGLTAELVQDFNVENLRNSVPNPPIIIAPEQIITDPETGFDTRTVFNSLETIPHFSLHVRDSETTPVRSSFDINIGEWSPSTDGRDVGRDFLFDNAFEASQYLNQVSQGFFEPEEYEGSVGVWAVNAQTGAMSEIFVPIVSEPLSPEQLAESRSSSDIFGRFTDMVRSGSGIEEIDSALPGGHSTSDVVEAAVINMHGTHRLIGALHSETANPETVQFIQDVAAGIGERIKAEYSLATNYDPENHRLSQTNPGPYDYYLVRGNYNRDAVTSDVGELRSSDLSATYFPESVQPGESVWIASTDPEANHGFSITQEGALVPVVNAYRISTLDDDTPPAVQNLPTHLVVSDVGQLIVKTSDGEPPQLISDSPYIRADIIVEVDHADGTQQTIYDSRDDFRASIEGDPNRLNSKLTDTWYFGEVIDVPDLNGARVQMQLYDGFNKPVLVTQEIGSENIHQPAEIRNRVEFEINSAEASDVDIKNGVTPSSAPIL